MTDDRHDPQAEAPKVADLSAKRKIAEEAGELLDDKGVFMAAVRAVRIRWFNALLETNDQAQIAKLHANLQALKEIPLVLQTAVNDHKMAADRQRRHG